jgi:hypothetical protein
MRRLLAPLLLASLAACSGLSTSFDYDTKYDFGGRERYAWIEGEGSSLTMTRIHAAVTDVLVGRGYEEVDEGEQLVFTAAVSSQDRVQVADYGYSYGYWGAPYGPRDVRVYEYQEGTLVLDVFDATSKQLVWRGIASKVVDDAWSPERREEEVRAAVEALLAKFPPGR